MCRISCSNRESNYQSHVISVKYVISMVRRLRAKQDDDLLTHEPWFGLISGQFYTFVDILIIH